MEIEVKKDQKIYIKEQIAKYNQKIRKLQEKFDNDVKKNSAWITKLQKKCRHEDTTNFSNHNNEVWTVCNICGIKESTNFFINLAAK